MELPITPKFFKKLEIYQEIKRLDKRNTKHSEWDMEKDLLIWAHTNHFHLGSFLRTESVLENLRILNKYTGKDLGNHTHKMMQNLVEHGWAVWEHPGVGGGGIKINTHGLLVGEVVSDLSKNKEIFYKSFVFISWLVIISGIIIVVANAISIVMGLL